MGDGMLVYFGYPQAHEHDAERAVHAGLAILDTVKALNHDNPHPEFGIAARIGIATGHVVVGELMGQDTAKERSVFGETPNLAARLQALAQPNQLIIDPVTKRLVGQCVRFRGSWRRVAERVRHTRPSLAGAEYSGCRPAGLSPIEPAT